MNSIQQVYEILSKWKDRFPNIRSVMVFLGEDIMILRWEWDNEKSPVAMHMIILSSKNGKAMTLRNTCLKPSRRHIASGKWGRNEAQISKRPTQRATTKLTLSSNEWTHGA